MSASIVQANYDTLEQVSSQFNVLQQNAEDVVKGVKSRMDPLLGGGWEGEGREKFESEMSQTVLPRLNRLCESLGETARMISTISSTMREAEENARNLLNQE